MKYFNERVQNAIFRQYISRDSFAGDEVENMFLSSEELASLWHFPVLSVKAPTVEKIGSKRSVPPSRLPYADQISEPDTKVEAPADEASPVRQFDSMDPGEPKPPSNLPTV